MSQIYKKILIVKRFGVKKIGENVTVKLNEAIKILTPDPSPNGEGRDHRGYPYFATCVVIRMWTYPDTSITNHQHLTLITQHPPLVITFCDICMPEAFCGFETVRKRFC